METLGEFIRRVREERDFSLRELAQKLKVTATFLSDIERNNRNPSDEVLKKVAFELDVTFDQLKKLDNRIPLKELKELFETNQDYGFAFRKVAESKITPDQLLDLVKEQDKQKKA